MKRLFLSCLFSTICIVIFSQYTITGKVTDGFGLPLIGANVYVERTYQGAVTDLNGEYAIRNLKRGAYYLNVSYVGYNTGSRIILLESDTRIDFDLTKANILADEVIVTST